MWYDIWYGMVWYDMMWYDMILCDMIWYDMIWYNTIWYVMWYHMVCLLQLVWHPKTVVQYTFTHKQYAETQWNITIGVHNLQNYIDSYKTFNHIYNDTK